MFIACFTKQLLRNAWSKHWIGDMPIITHSSNTADCRTEFKRGRNQYRWSTFWWFRWIFYIDKKFWKWDRTMNINKQPTKAIGLWQLTLDRIQLWNLRCFVYRQHTWLRKGEVIGLWSDWLYWELWIYRWLSVSRCSTLVLVFLKPFWFVFVYGYFACEILTNRSKEVVKSIHDVIALCVALVAHINSLNIIVSFSLMGVDYWTNCGFWLWLLDLAGLVSVVGLGSKFLDVFV